MLVFQKYTSFRHLESRSTQNCSGYKLNVKLLIQRSSTEFSIIEALLTSHLSQNSLNLNFQSLKWQGGEPKSACSEPCPGGSIKNFQDQCCWVCVKCNIDSYALNDTCISCGNGWRPNVNVTGCDKIPAEIIDWLSPWALVPLVFSSAGICFTIFTTCVFIR